LAFSDILERGRLGSGNEVAEILRHEFEKLQSPARRIDLCEWLAEWFERLEDHAQAGNWYEMAGDFILAQFGTSPGAAAVSALPEYERALDCYERADEDDGTKRCGQILVELRRLFASA
jgi:tetratricopeptide (TPR) repeat protein